MLHPSLKPASSCRNSGPRQAPFGHTVQHAASPHGTTVVPDSGKRRSRLLAVFKVFLSCPLLSFSPSLYRHLFCYPLLNSVNTLPTVSPKTMIRALHYRNGGLPLIQDLVLLWLTQRLHQLVQLRIHQQAVICSHSLTGRRAALHTPLT